MLWDGELARRKGTEATTDDGSVLVSHVPTASRVAQTYRHLRFPQGQRPIVVRSLRPGTAGAEQTRQQDGRG